MIRRARPDDLVKIVELGIEALEKADHPGMVISREKIEAIAKQCISSPKDFVWVAERGEMVMGAVCARTHDNLFFERQQATVVMCYCLIPGEGIKLLREFLRWARSRPIIKVISFTPEINSDPRIGKMLGRLGLRKFLTTYIEIK
jgi:hypothetical protein